MKKLRLTKDVKFVIKNYLSINYALMIPLDDKKCFIIVQKRNNIKVFSNDELQIVLNRRKVLRLVRKWNKIFHWDRYSKR